MTLYVAPYYLAQPSYWIVAILPLGVVIDLALRRAADDSDLAEARWPWAPFFIRYKLASISLVLVVAALMAVFGLTGAIAVAGLCLLVCTAVMCLYPASRAARQNIATSWQNKDGTVQYPGLLIGPINTMLVAEFLRWSGIWVLAKGGNQIEPVLIASILLYVGESAYWSSGYIAKINDEIRCGASGEKEERPNSVAHTSSGAGDG